jgi:hypothetical protein
MPEMSEFGHDEKMGSDEEKADEPIVPKPPVPLPTGFAPLVPGSALDELKDLPDSSEEEVSGPESALSPFEDSEAGSQEKEESSGENDGFVGFGSDEVASIFSRVEEEAELESRDEASAESAEAAEDDLPPVTAGSVGFTAPKVKPVMLNAASVYGTSGPAEASEQEETEEVPVVEADPIESLEELEDPEIESFEVTGENEESAEVIEPVEADEVDSPDALPEVEVPELSEEAGDREDLESESDDESEESLAESEPFVAQEEESSDEEEEATAEEEDETTEEVLVEEEETTEDVEAAGAEDEEGEGEDVEATEEALEEIEHPVATDEESEADEVESAEETEEVDSADTEELVGEDDSSDAGEPPAEEQSSDGDQSEDEEESGLAAELETEEEGEAEEEEKEDETQETEEREESVAEESGKKSVLEILAEGDLESVVVEEEEESNEDESSDEETDGDGDAGVEDPEVEAVEQEEEESTSRLPDAEVLAGLVAKATKAEAASEMEVVDREEELEKRRELFTVEQPSSRWAFWRRPSKRDQQLARVSEGYLEMVDLVRAIRGQLQSQTENNLILRDSLSHLPEAMKGLENFSKSQATVGKALKEIHGQLRNSGAKEQKLVQSMEGFNDSMVGFNDTLKGMDGTSKATMKTFDRVQERMRDSDIRMENLFQNVQKSEEKVSDTMVRLQRNMAIMQSLFLICFLIVIGVLVFTLMGTKDNPAPAPAAPPVEKEQPVGPNE